MGLGAPPCRTQGPPRLGLTLTLTLTLTLALTDVISIWSRPQARLSDRAQWMRWAYHHPHEARKHMRLLPGRAFNSMGSDYAEGDLVLHAGGGGAFGLHVFGKDKYVELLRRCQALQARSST